MAHFLPLAALGQRIMVSGPSNAGKSTLAVAIANKLAMPAMHVDLFRHLPDTDWVQRTDEDFAALHDAAIQQERWVMDGNYSALMPQRLARATGIILLGDNRWANLARYLRRTLFQKRTRPGSLAGEKDSLAIGWSCQRPGYPSSRPDRWPNSKRFTRHGGSVSSGTSRPAQSVPSSVNSSSGGLRHSFALAAASWNNNSVLLHAMGFVFRRGKSIEGNQARSAPSCSTCGDVTQL
jgi:adenylate kinase family enzyme